MSFMLSNQQCLGTEAQIIHEHNKLCQTTTSEVGDGFCSQENMTKYIKYTKTKDSWQGTRNSKKTIKKLDSSTIQC